MKPKFQKYYFRVIGYFLVFGGAGLLVDELITGAFNMFTIGHEWLGIAAIIVGGLLISKKPKGKEE